jgi:hypothetical protein
MELRVSACGRSGRTSERSAKHSSVHDITEPGHYWAVDAKVEGSNSRHLREGAIARFWRSEQDAQADADQIRYGSRYYKNSGRRYFDPVIQPARAYWQ